MSWRDVASLEELKKKKRMVIEQSGQPILLLWVDQVVYAILDVCSHDGGELADGDIEGQSIICSRHGAEFCLKTGQVLSPPAYEDIHVFPVRVQNQRIEVEIIEENL